MATEKENKDSSHGGENESKKKRRGVISRIWNGLFRIRGDDFEKRLQHLSKEEAAVLARIKRRSHTWRRMARHLIVFSVFFEIIAVVYAILTTRSLDLEWKMRAIRILPMFLLPPFSFASYSALLSFTRMCDRKDQKTLERLRAERQAKINELKERTNYYTTQQLIQQYDPDPAAKAAAATVLASKLGTDSGLKVYVGDESQFDSSSGKSNDVELVHTGGLRNRKDTHTRSGSEKGVVMHQAEGDTQSVRSGLPRNLEHEPLVVDHYDPNGSSVQDDGWIARIAALLVGEDPRQSYALICGNCHMHNGLARKEDYPYITYYCPHCNALNRPKQSEETVAGSTSPGMSSMRTGGESGMDVVNDATASGSGNPAHVTTGTASDLMETEEKSVTEDMVARKVPNDGA